MNEKEQETFSVTLGNEWKITADSYCYTLYRLKVRTSKSKNAGEIYSITEGYYTKIEDCLDAILEKNIKGFGTTTISDLLKKVQNARKEIKGYAEELRAVWGDAELYKKV